MTGQRTLPATLRASDPPAAGAIFAWQRIMEHSQRTFEVLTDFAAGQARADINVINRLCAARNPSEVLSVQSDYYQDACTRLTAFSRDMAALAAGPGRSDMPGGRERAGGAKAA